MRIIGQDRLADMLGVSRQTVNDWQAEGLPVEKRGGAAVPNEYHSAACINWVLERGRRRLSIETPRDRLARLQGDRVAIEIEDRLAHLVPADKIEPMWSAAVSAARVSLCAEPERLARILDVTEGAAAKRDLLAEAFDECLRRLAEHVPPDEEGDGDCAAIELNSP